MSEPARPEEGLRLTLRARVLESDPDRVRRLVESTGFFSPEEVAIAVELVEERLRRGCPSGYHFLFAEEGSEVRAYACYGPIPATQGSYSLYWIAVGASWQGRGVGRWLLGAVEERVRAAGGRRLYAETAGRAQYALTRRFYQRSGYRAEGVFADFYAPGDDKVVFVKSLG